MRTLVRGKGEETALWWHSQVLDKQGRMWKYGRAWLHWPGNSIGVCWNLFSSSCGFRIAFSDVSDSAIDVWVNVPFLFSLYFHLSRAKWVKRLPGVKWTGKWGSGEREIYIRIHDNTLWWTLWRNGDQHKSNDWRDSNFHFDDFLLGREKYAETERRPFDTLIEMPEGFYPAKGELYTSIWKRSRWPWPKNVNRADVEVEGGIPIPGDGDNGYDIDDDAIYGMTCPSGTVAEAADTIRESVMRDRQRNGGEDWAPSGGWPQHCITR